MAKECQTCGKKSRLLTKLVKLRGKYNPTIRKRKYPNLQWVHIPLDTKRKAFKPFAGKRIQSCAKCIKSLSKLK